MKFFLRAAFISVFILASGPGFAENIVIEETSYSNELSSLAELEIITKPEGAEIYIDDVSRGTSDIVLSLPEPGLHNLRIEKPGYATETIELRIRKNTGIEITAGLERLNGILFVETMPADASVTAGGYILSQGENELPTGQYRVSVSKEGFLSQNITVRVYKDEETRLIAGLEKFEEAENTETGSKEEKKGEADAETKHLSPVYGMSEIIGCSSPLVRAAGTAGLETGAGFSSLFPPYSTGSGAAIPVSAELSAVVISNLMITAGACVYTGTSVGDNDFFILSSSAQYRLLNNYKGLDIAVKLSGSMTGTSGYLAALELPAGFSFPAGELSAGFLLSPGINICSHYADGTAAGAPAFRPSVGTGFMLFSDSFASAISLQPVFSDFGNGFPALNSLIAGAGVKIPSMDQPATVTLFGRIDIFSLNSFEAGIAADFLLFQ